MLPDFGAGYVYNVPLLTDAVPVLRAWQYSDDVISAPEQAAG